MKNYRRRPKDYLVSATVGNVTRKMVWNETKLLPLDFPAGWTLALVKNKICLFDRSLKDPQQRKDEALFADRLSEGQSMKVKLPPSNAGRADRTLSVVVVPLKPIRSPYQQILNEAYDRPNVARQLMMSHGIRYLSTEHRSIGRKRIIQLKGKDLFTFSKANGAFKVVSHTSHLHFKFGTKKLALPKGMTRNFTKEEMFSCVFIFGIHWWRFRAVQAVDSMSPLRLKDTKEKLQDRKLFRFSIFIVATLIVSSVYFTANFKNVEPEYKSTHVTIESPKIIPHADIFAEVSPVHVLPPPPPAPATVEVVQQAKPPLDPEPIKKKPRIKKAIAKNKTRQKRIVAVVPEVQAAPAAPAVEKPVVVEPPPEPDYLEAKGITMMGPGTISEAKVEKALAKLGAKFQFCYEYAYINDSTLSGNLEIQWTIGPQGHVLESKAILWEIKSQNYANCVLAIMKHMSFPFPKGGQVTVKKTFNFTSTN